ncbi:MAG: lysophospholipid acyltransferase family protein, partial [Planctomycetota bacterium]|nr:lysophospholipid acyltransferase family protein [Planctomycetota bacterium]
AAYQHLFALAVEFARAPRAMSLDGWSSHVALGEVEEALAILSRHEPCILVTGHCGNWELQGAALGALGFRLHAVYRPLDVRSLDRWVQDSRARHGIYLVDKAGATTRLPELLAAGETIAFIADQNGGRKGMFVPFFDRLASAYKSIALLAMRFNAPIICGHTHRLGDLRSPKFQYRLDCIDIIRPDEWTGQPDPQFYITARYRRAIETMVRRAPMQYLWMHRYWKSRPKHEAEGRAFPAALSEKIRALPWMTEEEAQRIEARSSVDAELLAAEQEARRR